MSPRYRLHLQIERLYRQSGSSASIGVSFGTDGFLVTASASGSKGKANSNQWGQTPLILANQAVILALR